MKVKNIVQTDEAPKAIGSYSQAVVHSNTVYCSGQIAIVPDTGELIEGGIQAQTRQVMKNIEAVLDAAGSALDNVLKCSIFLADLGQFNEVNEIYGEYFASNKPARETVGVKALPKNALIEISCIAHL